MVAAIEGRWNLFAGHANHRDKPGGVPRCSHRSHHVNRPAKFRNEIEWLEAKGSWAWGKKEPRIQRTLTAGMGLDDSFH